MHYNEETVIVRKGERDMTIFIVIIAVVGFFCSYCFCKAASRADEPLENLSLDEEDQWLQSYYNNKKRS